MRLYLDTAYIAKCYVNEPDGHLVRNLVRSADALYSSGWCVAEMACVIQRKIREGSLDTNSARRVQTDFSGDIATGLWTLLPVSERLLSRSALFVARLPADVYLRAGDSVHLVSAEDAGFTEIWTNDRHLVAAARHAGIIARSV